MNNIFSNAFGVIQQTLTSASVNTALTFVWQGTLITCLKTNELRVNNIQESNFMYDWDLQISVNVAQFDSEVSLPAEENVIDLSNGFQYRIKSISYSSGNEIASYRLKKTLTKLP
jgi:hypothetical protein